jgi:sugar phosphate isomerase/epimerase
VLARSVLPETVEIDGRKVCKNLSAYQSQRRKLLKKAPIIQIERIQLAQTEKSREIRAIRGLQLVEPNDRPLGSVPIFIGLPDRSPSQWGLLLPYQQRQTPSKRLRVVRPWTYGLNSFNSRKEVIMGAISRREFLERAAASSAVVGFLSSNVAHLGANPLGWPIGSHVYPLRGMLKDFPAFVKMMADIGVTRLELCSPIGYGADFAMLANGKEVKKILADHGMKAESSHFSMEELRDSHDKSIAWAQEVGITQMVTATLGDGNGGSNPTMDQVKKAADEYNKIAAVSAKAGIQQGLHNEGFELSMVDGKRTYDMLFDLLDPKLVMFQFQMSTITAGLVGAEYFLKYPGRFNSMHVQDVNMNAPIATPSPKEGAPAGRGGRGGRRPQVAVGQGTIDWVKTFTAAKTGGVKNYFVEQNWELTQQSVAYLKTLTV